MKCPECHAKFEYDDRMECIFVDTDDLRLPVHGTVCPQCGLGRGWMFRGVCTVGIAFAVLFNRESV